VSDALDRSKASVNAVPDLPSILLELEEAKARPFVC
jgi:hypothetical protein